MGMDMNKGMGMNKGMNMNKGMDMNKGMETNKGISINKGMGNEMEVEVDILSKNCIIECGIEFDGDMIDYSWECDQRVCDLTDPDNEKPITGVLYELHPNGNIANYCYYENGIKNGANVTFYENGDIESKGAMLYGTRHGLTVWHHENGSVKSRITYKYGYVASSKEWDDKGGLVEEINEPTEFAKKMIEKYDRIENER